MDKLRIIKAEHEDLPEILALQKLAYQSEAELVNDYAISPLTQTLKELKSEFKNGIILKAVYKTKIIGSVRGHISEDTLYIGRLMVDPGHQNQGAGTKLLKTIEEMHPENRKELFTSTLSEKNLSLYQKNGYKEFKRENVNPNLKFVYLEKFPINNGSYMLRNMTSIYIINKDKILLLYRVGSKIVDPSWCGIGGHFEEYELNDPKSCVLRELYEETGITSDDIRDIEMRYITLRLKNNEIRQNYYFFANLSNLDIKLQKCNEGILEWVDITKALERDMPITAKYCLQHYFSDGKNNKKIYNGVATSKGINWVLFEEF